MRRAIVTGASRGIGRAIAEMLLADGWIVEGIARSATCLHPDRYWGWECDISTDELPEWTRSIDALIHCAGIRGPYGPFAETDLEAFAETVCVNLLGTARIVKAALPSLQRSDDARILLFSGGGAFGPSPDFSAYGASKAGVVALAESLAVELSETTVTVNAIAPGFVPTSIHDGTPHAGKDDAGVAMANAVECIRHMLSPATRGLTGKTVSAQWDDFRSIDQTNVAALNASEMGTRTRCKIQCVRGLVRSKRLVAV